jgi:CubicO group peptidase (beta-lactamase class C family)
MKGFLTSQTLNEDTVFRVGSVSKLITVYTLLAEVGMERMHDPVTRWVPELARAAKKNKGDPARRVQWDEVTIGQLCGHMAGISRNRKHTSGFYEVGDSNNRVSWALRHRHLYWTIKH